MTAEPDDEAEVVEALQAAPRPHRSCVVGSGREQEARYLVGGHEPQRGQGMENVKVLRAELGRELDEADGERGALIRGGQDDTHLNKVETRQMK